MPATCLYAPNRGIRYSLANRQDQLLRSSRTGGPQVGNPSSWSWNWQKIILFCTKKLECRSQLGRVSAKSEPHCPTPSSLFTSRSMQYTLIPLTFFHEWNGRKYVSRRMRNAKLTDKRPNLQPIKSGVSLLALTKSHIWRWNRGSKPAPPIPYEYLAFLAAVPFYLASSLYHSFDCEISESIVA